jgi:chemotaxis protein CheD
MAAVRMGEIAVSGHAGDELVARGLGSCIGLVLVDRLAGVAGLAHIVLPESSRSDREPGKFADLAVPQLITEMCREGATRRRLEAVLAGGARMFELGDLDVGNRNEAAVREKLARCGLPVRAAETGGNKGRTMRVSLCDCTVTVKEVGAQPMTVLPGATDLAQRRQRNARAEKKSA